MDFLHLAQHVLEHSIADTLYLLPFLFVTYLAMEWLEHKTNTKTQEAISHAGAAGPAIGALLGAIPQCGFSAAGATLYAGRVITVGTLFAVFLSTSDEMLPIFIARGLPASEIISILAVKIAVGVVAGFLIDAVIRIAGHGKRDLRIHELCRDANCGCGQECETCQKHPERVYEHNDDFYAERDLAEHEHGHDHAYGWGKIFKSALIHTLQILLFCFIITIILNILIESIGEDALASMIGGDSFLSIVSATLVGLIPNCAASLVIADLFVEGLIGSGTMIAGLLMAAGIGLLVLVRTNKDQGQNLAIIVGMFAISVACGYAVSLLGINFG